MSETFPSLIGCVPTAPQGPDDEIKTFRIEFKAQTSIWSVNGGYIGATMLRACEQSTAQRRPSNIAIQFLRAVAPGEAAVAVTWLRRSSAADLCEVRLTQAGQLAAIGHVWMTSTEGGDSISLKRMPPVPHPDELKNVEHLLRPGEAPRHAFWDVFEDRPINRTNSWALQNRSPRALRWMRYRGVEEPSSSYLRAGMLLPVMDLLGLPAASNAMGENALKTIAPTIQLAAQFYRLDRFDGWLLGDAHAEGIHNSLVNSRVGIWSVDGSLVAQGLVQMLSRPRSGAFTAAAEDRSRPSAG